MTQATPDLHDVVEASLITIRDIYKRDGMRLAARHHEDSALDCCSVALAINTLLQHPGAITMLTGRVRQFLSGEKS